MGQGCTNTCHRMKLVGAMEECWGRGARREVLAFKSLGGSPGPFWSILSSAYQLPLLWLPATLFRPLPAAGSRHSGSARAVTPACGTLSFLLDSLNPVSPSRSSLALPAGRLP